MKCEPEDNVDTALFDAVCDIWRFYGQDTADDGQLRFQKVRGQQ